MVIAIVGMLAGLITAAAWHAVIAGKNTVITVEISQLDAACKAYKEKFGEYPPDFACVDSGYPPPVLAEVRQIILRHLAKAFPKYQPGVSTNGAAGYVGTWAGLRADILGNLNENAWFDSNLPEYEGWSIDIDTLSPACALTFFLGGKPDWRINSAGYPIFPGDTTSTPPFDTNMPIKGFLGFSANPLNPFDNSPSRIRPFYDYDIMSIGWWLPTGGTAGGLAYWPKVQSVVDKTHGPFVYFRAENGNYTRQGTAPNAGGVNPANNVKHFQINGDCLVWPAIDVRLSSNLDTATATVTWMNPQSFQIFASGLDLEYSPPFESNGHLYGLWFPDGGNYDPNGRTYDDITNFSGGTLESAMP